MYVLIGLKTKTSRCNRLIFFKLSGLSPNNYFKVNNAIDTLINTKLGSQVLESGLDSSSEKAVMTIKINNNNN